MVFGSLDSILQTVLQPLTQLLTSRVLNANLCAWNGLVLAHNTRKIYFQNVNGKYSYTLAKPTPDCILHVLVLLSFFTPQIQSFCVLGALRNVPHNQNIDKSIHATFDVYYRTALHVSVIDKSINGRNVFL